MKAYLIFEDGIVMQGTGIGKRGQQIGEMVFTTATTGYVETLSDPSFYGQIITLTFPLVGNYGVMLADMESDNVYAKGLVVRQICDNGSNFRKDCDLNDFLIKYNVVGISEVDTREIAKKVRDCGRINAMITDNLNDLPKKIAQIKAFKIKDSMQNLSVKHPQQFGQGKTVVLWDFGVKNSIVNQLTLRGLKVIKVPHSYTAQQILALNPSGILLSNGGGDPAENKQVIAELKVLLQSKVPMFGICLGHQLLSLAIGGKTKKLKFGHRGANQPVKDTDSGRIYITSQNHGYAVLASSLPTDKVKVRYINAGDKTCEGIDFLDAPVFSVQFHPEASAGPIDTLFLFDRFKELIDKHEGQ